MIDRIDGYRMYGLVASVLWGALWIVLNSSLLMQRGAIEATRPTIAAQP